LNHDYAYAGGLRANELNTWNHLRMLSPALSPEDVAKFVTLAAPDDTSRSIDDRADPTWMPTALIVITPAAPLPTSTPVMARP